MQCKSISLALPGKTSFPTDQAYTTSLASYFSQQEEQISPSCIVTPATSEDVAIVVGILSEANAGKEACPFAIRGGGHSTFAGAANVANGVTIDMREISQVSVNQDGTVASIGAGALWRDVYAKLDAMNLAVPGGRVSEVGVAGLTLGGRLIVWHFLSHSFRYSGIGSLLTNNSSCQVESRSILLDMDSCATTSSTTRLFWQAEKRSTPMHSKIRTYGLL